MRIKRIWASIVAGFLLLILMLPQLALAAGPVISNVVVLDHTSTTATITWTTNNISDSRVNYGTTTALGQTKYDSAEVTTHFIDLTGLTPNKTYYFEIQSTDGSGTSTDNNSGAFYSFITLPVTAYSITLDSVCGVCGELIDVGVCGEVIGVTALVTVAGTYYIRWDSPTGNIVATFTATGAGSHTLMFYLPEARKGIHNVYLTIGIDEKAKAPYEVLPSVKIDPEDGPMGTAVNLNGYGFNASQDIQIKFKDTVIKTTKANTVGSWNVTYAIPATPAGGYIFKVEAKEGTVWVGWVSKYFAVTPKIIVSSSSGSVGQAIQVSGTGFASKEKDIEITFGGEVVKEIISAEENGSWSVTIAVPPVQKGSYIIDASGMSTRARDVDGVEFVVNAGILVEPISAYVGDTITVEGGGFAPGETGIRVYFDGQLVTQVIITADSDGCWESSFVLSASSYGSHTVSASGDITKPAVTTSLSTQARIIELSPVDGAPGDPVSLTGDGFGSSKGLTVTIGGIAASVNMLTQTNGNVVISFRVPKGSTEGTRTLVVTDAGGATASVDFTVKKKTILTTPLPISPEGSTLRSGEVTFRWQGIPSGSDFNYTYTLEISQTAGAGSIWSKPNIPESSYTLKEDEALPKGTYYWRVKMVDDYGNESTWSDSIEFRVSPIPTWVWVVVGVVVLVVLMVVAYRETKFKVAE